MNAHYPWIFFFFACLLANHLIRIYPLISGRAKTVESGSQSIHPLRENRPASRQQTRLGKEKKNSPGWAGGPSQSLMVMRNAPSWNTASCTNISTDSFSFTSFIWLPLTRPCLQGFPFDLAWAEKEPRFITAISFLRRWSEETASRLHAACYLPVQYNNFT